MAISFFDAPKQFPEKKILKIALKQTALEAGFRLKVLNYIFVSDEALLEINRKHLQHDFFTDIITFDMSENPNLIEGDIFISTVRVIENGKTIGTGVEEEFVRVVGHGLLHLLGHKDKTKAESIAMRSAEMDFIKRYFGLKELQ